MLVRKLLLMVLMLAEKLLQKKERVKGKVMQRLQKKVMLREMPKKAKGMPRRAKEMPRKVKEMPRKAKEMPKKVKEKEKLQRKVMQKLQQKEMLREMPRKAKEMPRRVKEMP